MNQPTNITLENLRIDVEHFANPETPEQLSAQIVVIGPDGTAHKPQSFRYMELDGFEGPCYVIDCRQE